MIVTFYDREDEANELNGAVIRDRRRLRQVLESLLESLQVRWPFVCELVGENGFQLTIGVGKIGCVHYSRCDGSPPYLMAVARRNVLEADEPEFMLGGTPTPIPAHFCMPFDDVIDIAVYFMETGRASPFFSWEQ